MTAIAASCHGGLSSYRADTRWSALVGIFTGRRVLAAAIGLAILLFGLGWAFREDPSHKPYLAILGGGFIFNYRVAEVFYGFTAVVERPLATGSIIEATFENPAGGKPFVVSSRVGTGTARYTMRSPPVHGVVAGRPYHVVVRVYDRQRKELLWTATRDYESAVGDEVMPAKPLTIGPGYTPNPDP